MKISEFIEANGLKFYVTHAPTNPHMDADDKWARDASHWFCKVFKAGDGTGAVNVYFSQGSAHRKAPTLAQRHRGEHGDPKPPDLATVLDCLASDASGIDQPFEDWASDFGYDPDSRRALATYETVQKQTTALRKLLGTAAFQTLLTDVERL